MTGAGVRQAALYPLNDLVTIDANGSYLLLIDVGLTVVDDAAAIAEECLFARSGVRQFVCVCPS